MNNNYIKIPNFDPVALSIGPLGIRWYSLAYIFGILISIYWLSYCNKKEKILSDQASENIIIWVVLSIMIGGRLGYVLFYNFNYFLSNPLEIIAFWHGGMSFHGGLIGIICGLWLFCKKYKINYFKLTDKISVIAPTGLFLGRIANFINLELYGRITYSNFGVIFPNTDGLPRHPSQLYEAFFEGLLSFTILILLYKYTKISKKIGALSGLFLIMYGAFRILIENFREPDFHIGLFVNFISMGQILSLPLILTGIIIIIKSRKISEKKLQKK